ncbi:diguanylate cyclase [Povalibacter sp.]|uniref:GGDEF domain-containing protein n=1 Tax=Povalibacter sp. TaxID=1962978 RepID=UPI002F41CF88
MPQSPAHPVDELHAATGAHAGRPRRKQIERWASRLFPTLTFEKSLESQFRRWYAEHVHARIRNLTWIPIVALLLAMFAGGPFGDLRTEIFGTDHEPLLDVVRFGLVLPSSLLLLSVTYTSLYTHWYTLAAQIVLPLQAVTLVILNGLMDRQGYSLSSLMPLLTLTPFFLLGMSQAQALRTVAVIFAVYAFGGYHTAGLSSGQWSFDLAVEVFTASIGAALHFSLQKSLRQSYLSTQIMSESLNRDALTGIHNRRMFDEHAARLWQQAARTGAPVALLMIDIDHFKAFNDYGGHQAGDACLIKVASALNRAARRPLDLTARYGGEEFAVLLYDTNRASVEELCRELHAGLEALAIQHPAFTDGQLVTFSIGAACVEPRPERRVEGLIQLADEALYAAKERGRNRSVVMDREYETLRTGVFRVKRRRETVAA